MLSPQQLNEFGSRYLPGYLGIVITQISGPEIRSELAIRQSHMAPNGYLHAGTVVTLADTSAGYGCTANLPAGAVGFSIRGIGRNELDGGFLLLTLQVGQEDTTILRAA